MPIIFVVPWLLCCPFCSTPLARRTCPSTSFLLSTCLRLFQQSKLPSLISTSECIALIPTGKGGYTQKVEEWMAVQKQNRIYDLGSLPPFLLVLAGNIKAVDHRWNQHGLGGDNLEGKCRNLHPGPISLLHWSGKGKPWLRTQHDRICFSTFRTPCFPLFPSSGWISNANIHKIMPKKWGKKKQQ
ncbi:unnamed protein product, partial [Vitis vinifera]